jgi:hypothetical protein
MDPGAISFSRDRIEAVPSGQGRVTSEARHRKRRLKHDEDDEVTNDEGPRKRRRSDKMRSLATETHSSGTRDQIITSEKSHTRGSATTISIRW